MSLPLLRSCSPTFALVVTSALLSLASVAACGSSDKGGATEVKTDDAGATTPAPACDQLVACCKAHPEAVGCAGPEGTTEAQCLNLLQRNAEVCARSAPENANENANANATPDAGPSDAAPDATPRPTGTCPKDIRGLAESSYYRPPHRFTKGACTEADIKAINKPGGGSFPKRKALVSAACQACIYSNLDDPEWGLVVVLDPDNGPTNWAAYVAANGASPECAKARNWQWCTKAACSACPNQDSQNTCGQHEVESPDGQCKALADTNDACPTSGACTDTFCAIAELCGP